MAKKRGCLGVVHVGTTASGATNAVGELTDWSIEQTAERIDASTMGTCAKSFEAGAEETTITINCFWDGDNAYQALFGVGDTVHLRVYPEGTGSGVNWYKTPAGGATVITVNHSGNGVDGIVGSTFTCAVNGAMTATATP